jgi:hypothetical protein
MQGVETNLRHQERHQYMRTERSQQRRVTIGCAADRVECTDDTTGARSIVDDDRLSQRFSPRDLDGPGDRVGGSPRAARDDQFHGS